MKKIFFTIAMAVISYCSYAQYLPLTAGNSNPLTGDLYIDGINGNRLIFSYGGTSNDKALLGSTYAIFGAGSKDDLATYIKNSNPYSIWTNGIQRLVIDATGKVGIGTTNPLAPLDITGGGSSSSIAGLATTLTARINTGNPAVSLGIGYVPSDNPMLQAFNNLSNTANNLTINPFGGFVGINTSNPGANLDVNGSGNFSGNVGIVKLTPTLTLDGSGFGSSGSIINLLGWAAINKNWQVGVGNFGPDGLTFTPSTAVGGNSFATPAMLINSNGKVGIGTTNPLAPLDITGGGSSSSIADLATTLTARINTGNPAVSLGVGYVPSDNPILQAFNNVHNTANNLAVNPFGGFVGINTSNPGANLDVNGTGNFSGNVGIVKSTPTLTLDGSGFGSSGSIINLLGWAAINKNWQIGVGNFGPDGLTFTPSTAVGGNSFATPAMLINSDGSMAIGTTAVPAGYKLAIAGNAIAESMTVKLQSAWGDYVFKKDYALMPLSEVKTYIDKNQHLPEIPAAAEVEKDGVNLGEMNRLLVKKVEELTLYLIEKDNKDKEKEIQLKEQHEINKSQQQQIDDLKQQLNALTKALNKN